jgi:hypothetical protein
MTLRLGWELGLFGLVFWLDRRFWPRKGEDPFDYAQDACGDWLCFASLGTPRVAAQLGRCKLGLFGFVFSPDPRFRAKNAENWVCFAQGVRGEIPIISMVFRDN